MIRQFGKHPAVMLQAQKAALVLSMLLRGCSAYWAATYVSQPAAPMYCALQLENVCYAMVLHPSPCRVATIE